MCFVSLRGSTCRAGLGRSVRFGGVGRFGYSFTRFFYILPRDLVLRAVFWGNVWAGGIFFVLLRLDCE